MSDPFALTLLLAVATFSARYLGIVAGRHLPRSGPWNRGLTALPGCLIVSLVTVLLVEGGPHEWAAGGIALTVAMITRSLPMTMVAGIVAVWLLRVYL